FGDARATSIRVTKRTRPGSFGEVRAGRRVRSGSPARVAGFVRGVAGQGSVSGGKTNPAPARSGTKPHEAGIGFVRGVHRAARWVRSGSAPRRPLGSFGETRAGGWVRSGGGREAVKRRSGLARSGGSRGARISIIIIGRRRPGVPVIPAGSLRSRRGR